MSDQKTLEAGKLTVIIPHYMHHDLIAETIDALSKQTRRPDKIVVIDDGSTSASFIAMQKVVNEFDIEIQIIREIKNLGTIARLNQGLALTGTEFVTFLAADDFIANELYDKTVRQLNNSDQSALCGVNVVWVNPFGKKIPKPRPIPALQKSGYFSPDQVKEIITSKGLILDGIGTVYRTQPLRDLGGYDKGLHSFTDGYIMHVLAMRHGMNYIFEDLSFWRKLPNSYAHKSARDPSISSAILDRVSALVLGRDKDVFQSNQLRNRFLARVRFQNATNFCSVLSNSAKTNDKMHLMAIAGGYLNCLGIPPFSVLRKIVLIISHAPYSRILLAGTAFCLLRPYDIIFAITRRYKM